jgi:glycosyltransferase involved in cell wall biosynthesis
MTTSVRPTLSRAVPILSIVVPVFNEAETITTVIERLLQVPDLLEIMVVDDGSSDGTGEILQRLANEHPVVTLVTHEENRGKTAALANGFAKTRGEIVVVQDADLEYDPADIPDLIEPIKKGVADVVYGSRFLVKRASRVIYFYHYIGNRFLTLLSNVFTNLNMTDVETGYKAFRGELIRNMVITASGFGFEIEVTAKLAKLKCAFYEVPVSYYGRTYEEGKKITWRDGLAALFYIFRFNLFCSLKKAFKQPHELASTARSLKGAADDLST